MLEYAQRNRIALLLVFTSALFYGTFAYDLERSDFFRLFTLYSGLFLLSWKIYNIKKTDLLFLALSALLFRLLFWFSIPGLSQDFYRFLWDGEMALAGISPYGMTPEEHISAGPLQESLLSLYQGMGHLSAGNHTSYPPLNQLFFTIAAFTSEKGLLLPLFTMRCITLVADLGILLIGGRLLRSLGLPEHKIFLYLLNPLVIIEMTGNVHYESVMICFLLLGLFLVYRSRWIYGGLAIAAAVSTKLIPLMYLPVLINWLKFRKGILFSFGVLLILLLGFLPFVTKDFLTHFLSSVSLWFEKFEFNASVIYLLRWVGQQVVGYNILIYSGPGLAVVSLAFILLLSWRKSLVDFQQVLVVMLWSTCIYFLLSSTVHPWYLATPLALSVFTRYRFMLAWSYLSFLSYSAYQSPQTEENFYLLGVEYLGVGAVIIYDLYRSQEYRMK